jgi:hypothetical protein
MRIEIEITEHDERALAYLLPIVNAARRNDHVRPLEAVELARELLQRALWTDVRAYEQAEEVAIATLFKAGSEETKAAVRAVLGGVQPPQSVAAPARKEKE